MADQEGMLRGTGPLVAGVRVSVLISEAHNYTATATKLALESGAQVTDHVIINPDDVTVTFAMTNTNGGGDVARDVLETFRGMMTKRDLLELTTEHRIYENMVIIGIAPLHQAPYKGALNVTLRLQQISFVRLESVGRQNTKGASKKTAAPKANAGQQEAKPVEKSRIKKMQDAYSGGKS